MRYFIAYYDVSEYRSASFRSLPVLHECFEDRAFALPYWCGWSDNEEAFAISLVVRDADDGTVIAQDYARQALALWGIEGAQQTRLVECTVRDCFMESGRCYSACDFEECDVRKQLNLTTAWTLIHRASFGMRDTIVAPLDALKAAERANDTGFRNDLGEELGRIFEPAKPFGTEAGVKEVVHAPISYLVESDAASEADEVATILLGAMQQAGRFGSGLVFSLNVDEFRFWPLLPNNANEFGLVINQQFLRAIEGNTLVLRYGVLESDNGYDVDAYKLLLLLLDLVEKASCETQLILSVPTGKSELVMRLRKSFNKPFVVLSKDKGADLTASSFEGNLSIMRGMAAARGLECDELMGKLLLKRMHAGGDLGLEMVFEEWVSYHEGRMAFPQYASAIEEAVDLGATTGEEESALTRLEGLIGLDGVKDHIHSVLMCADMSQKMLERGLPLRQVSMHMAFLGAPGTGKTEVAKLYAEILKDKGVLSEGRLVTVSGGALFNVEKAFRAARGSVLFVDEAYGMLGCENMVTEFIAQMENCRSDTVVILAGYAGQINALLDSNPGFRSRVRSIIEFPDYTPDELRQIFGFMAARERLLVAPEAEEVVRDALERAGRREDQGNARYVRNLFDEARNAQLIRLAKWLEREEGDSLSADDLCLLTEADATAAVEAMGGVREKYPVPARKELEDLVGLENVKRLVTARMDFAKMQKVKRDAGMEVPFVPLHMAFKGSPGTGKTEVARLVGRILREEGVLSVGDFYECGHQDLVSPIVGQTAAKVESLFRKARGSVIFIDEAYSLIDGAKSGPGTEAITTIVDQMEKLREEVVVIFAGYTREIDNLLAQNPGFTSRVKVHLDFPDYTGNELVEILRYMACRQGYRLAEGTDEVVRGITERAKGSDGFGNARFVRGLLEDAIVEQSVRLAAKVDGVDLAPEELRTLLPEDFVWNEPKGASRNPIGFVA